MFKRVNCDIQKILQYYLELLISLFFIKLTGIDIIKGNYLESIYIS